jgi:hypothetical protein
VDCVAGFDKDGDQGECIVAREIVAFEVGIEVGLGGGFWEIGEDDLEQGSCVDHFNVHVAD